MSSEALSSRFALPPEVEDERVRSLEQLNILDTPPEDRFARITRMARCAFDVPMASVNLIDRERQWFKQADGMALGGQTKRGDSVCQATIARTYEQPAEPALILEDAADSEFASVPGIGGADGIRFYAGYPLYGPGGHPVGTFCVYDTRPRALAGSELQTFKELAAWAQRELESSDDLERASDVQRQLLPRPLGDLPGYSVCSLCLPAYAVGGDFYDHYRVQGGAIFTVADVMGKGLGAAILAASVRSSLRAASRAVDRLAATDVDVADTVNAVAAQLADDLASTDSFVTLFHAKIDVDSGRVDYVDAGHGFAVVIRDSLRVEPLNSADLPIGVLPGADWTAHEVTLQPGDTLVIASDGVLDLVGDGSDVRPALKVVAQHRDPADLCAYARNLHSQQPPLDDVTVVAIRRELP